MNNHQSNFTTQRENRCILACENKLNDIRCRSWSTRGLIFTQRVVVSAQICRRLPGLASEEGRGPRGNPPPPCSSPARRALVGKDDLAVVKKLHPRLLSLSTALFLEKGGGGVGGGGGFLLVIMARGSACSGNSSEKEEAPADNLSWGQRKTATLELQRQKHTAVLR